MNRTASTLRALIMPVAFVGLAIAAPEGLAVSGSVAGQVVEHTVGRAEALSGQLSLAVRQLCQNDQPSAPMPANLGTPAPLADDQPIVACSAISALITPARRLGNQSLINLPPPTDC